MSFNLYDATIAVLMRELTSLKGVLKKGEAWCDEQGKPHSYLLERSLAPDMFPLPQQIWICCTYSKHAATRLGKAEIDPVEDNQKTFAELYERIDGTIALLQKEKPEDYNDVDKTVKPKFPGVELTFSAKSYAQRMILPTFFFHSVAAYLILRNAGVPVGKADYHDLSTITDP